MSPWRALVATLALRPWSLCAPTFAAEGGASASGLPPASLLRARTHGAAAGAAGISAAPMRRLPAEDAWADDEGPPPGHSHAWRDPAVAAEEAEAEAKLAALEDRVSELEAELSEAKGASAAGRQASSLSSRGRAADAAERHGPAEPPADAPRSVSAEASERHAASASSGRSSSKPAVQRPKAGEEVREERKEAGEEAEEEKHAPGGEAEEGRAGEEAEAAAAEAEGGEEEEEFTKTDMAVAMMLLGSVVMVMSMFIATNLRDEDMRLYVWQVISSTISIFVAVLVFTTINDLVHHDLLLGASYLSHVFGDIAQCLFCNFMMQYTVALCSGVWEETPYRANTRNSIGDLVSITEQQKSRDIGMRCWASLFAHIAGFSNINAGLHMQRGFWKDNYIIPFCAVMVMSVLLWILNVMFRCWRARSLRFKQPPHRSEVTGYVQVAQDPADSGEVEELHLYAKKQWEECIYETENEASALCLSFLLAQALRYCITSVMPNSMGVEDRTRFISLQSIFNIGAAAAVFVVLTVFMVIAVTKLASHQVTTQDMKNMNMGFSWSIFFRMLAKRALLVNAQTTAMCMAWCMLAEAQMSLMKWLPAVGAPTTIICRVVLALLLSIGAFCVTLVLDRIADAKCSDDTEVEYMLDLSVIRIINAIAIMVGFSWEQAFDGGVEIIVATFPFPPRFRQPVLFESIGTSLISLLVLFAWRNYIMGKVVHLEALREAKLERARRNSAGVRNSIMPKVPGESCAVEDPYAFASSSAATVPSSVEMASPLIDDAVAR